MSTNPAYYIFHPPFHELETWCFPGITDAVGVINLDRSDLERLGSESCSVIYFERFSICHKTINFHIPKLIENNVVIRALVNVVSNNGDGLLEYEKFVNLLEIGTDDFAFGLVAGYGTETYCCLLLSVVSH